MTLKRLTVLVWLVGVFVTALPAAAQAAENITIGSTGNPATYTDSGGTIVATADDAQVGASVVESDLAAGHNVTVGTGNSGTQPGIITVASPVASSATGSLTLNPAASIKLAADIGIGGPIGFGGPVSLTADVSLTTTNSTVTFSGTLDGGSALTVNAGTGAANFMASVGGTTPLASLSLTAGAINLSAGSVTTTGPQTYTAPVTLVADTSLAAGTGAVSFSSSVDGGQSLTVSSAGSVTIGGKVGGVTPISALTTPSGAAVTLNGNVTTTSTQSYGGAVTLGADSGFYASGGAVIFSSTVDSAISAQPRSLTVSAATGVDFQGAVGGNHPLASLITSGVPTSLAENATTTLGQAYGPTTLSNHPVTLSAGTGSAVTFASTVDGYTALTVSQAGSLSFGGAVGGTHSLTDLTIGNGIPTTLSGDVTASGNQTYNGPLTLGTSAITLAALNTGSQISLQGVDGTPSDTLTLTGSGSTTLRGTSSVNIQVNAQHRFTVLGTENGTIKSPSRFTTLGCTDGSTVGTINGKVTTAGSVFPNSLPTRPSGIPAATPGNGAAIVSGFTPGGVTCHPTTYLASTSNGPRPSSTGTEANPSPLTVTGLANGTPYRFNVVAVNPLGSSSPSPNSNEVTPQQPTTSISSPGGGGNYNVGQSVPTQFSCTYASSCVDSSGSATGSGRLYTGTAGTYTYKVTATPSSGAAVSTQITYTVTAPPPTPSPTADAPTAAISSPRNNQTYTAGALVHPIFKCTEGHGGPGLVACRGNGVNNHLNTSHAGHYTYTVTAVSADGQRGHASINYTVVAPSNRFSLHSVKSARAGVVSFSLKLPDAGTISVTETAVIGGHAKVYARARINREGGTVKLWIGPRSAGRTLLRDHPHLVIGLSVSFTPKYGNTRTLKSIPVRLRS